MAWSTPPFNHSRWVGQESGAESSLNGSYFDFPVSLLVFAETSEHNECTLHLARLRRFDRSRKRGKVAQSWGVRGALPGSVRASLGAVDKPDRRGIPMLMLCVFVDGKSLSANREGLTLCPSVFPNERGTAQSKGEKMPRGQKDTRGSAYDGNIGWPREKSSRILGGGGGCA